MEESHKQTQPAPTPQERPVIQSYSQQADILNPKQKVPMHFMVIAGMYVLASLYAFLSGSVSDLNAGNEFLYIMLGLLGLMVSVGLFMRMPIARKFAIAISVFAIISYAAGIIGMLSINRQLNILEGRYNKEVAEIRADGTTAQQEENINKLDQQVKEQRAQLSSVMPIFYSSMVINIAINGLFVAYLMTPRVKKLFKPASPKI